MALNDDKGVLIQKATIESSDGQPTEKEVKSWIDQQVPYANYAGRVKKLDEDVLQFVEGTVTGFRTAMIQAYDRWADAQSVANGDSLAGEYEDDVHVPETYKMLQAKVAHEEEAMWDIDPPFSVEGTKGELSRMKALLLSSYIRRQLELAGHRRFIRPTMIDAELTGWAIMKVHWDRKMEEVVEREIRFEELKGRMVMHDERRLKRVLAKDGAALQQVDPFRFVIDLDAGQVEDCAFIGDESDQFVHILEQQADLGLYSKAGVKALKERTQGNDSDSQIEFHDLARRSRSVIGHWDQQQYAEQHRSARRVRAIEIWGLYDFREGYDGVVHPDGRRITGVQKVVITKAEGVVLQLRLNPLDKKFAPYGVGRVNSNGHEMVSVAPFDLVVTSNAQYDRYQSAVLRNAELAVDPIVMTTNDTDLPDNMLGVRAGTIFRNPGQLQQFKIGDLPASAAYMHQYFRREHEELSGYLRVFESAPDTATETERKVQMQSLLLRPSVRAVGEMWRQVALIIYWMEGQFGTQTQRFRVMGKASKVLGQYAAVTPDMLLEPIDVRFHGADSLQTHHQKIASLKQWINSWGPLLPTMPGVSLENAARIDFEYSVGPEYVDQIFKGQTPEWMLWTQDEENWMLDRGEEVAVNEADDDVTHLEHMVERLKGIKDKPYRVRRAYLLHFDQHMKQAAKKEQQRKQEMARRQEEAEQMQMQQGAAPGQGRPAAPGGMPAKRVTNGPEQPRTVSRTGRDGMGISQTQEMAQK